MCARSLLVTIGALFVLQVSGGTPETQWENVQRWMHKTVQDLKDSSTDIAQAYMKVQSSRSAEIQKASKTFESSIQKQVAALQEEAKKAGVDISDCIKEVSDGGNSLSSTLLKGAQKCVSDQGAKIQNLVSHQDQLIVQVQKTLRQAQQDWTACESSSNKVKCEGEVVADAGLKEADYAKQEATLLTEANTFINNVESETKTCVAKEIASATSNLNSEVKKTAQCAENKINA